MVALPQEELRWERPKRQRREQVKPAQHLSGVLLSTFILISNIDKSNASGTIASKDPTDLFPILAGVNVS